MLLSALLVALGSISVMAQTNVYNINGVRTGPAYPEPPPAAPSTPDHSDLTLLQCGNLIYAGNKSSVCFADSFLTDVAAQTNLKVNKKFCPVRLDAEALFDYPFCVMSGNENFALPQKERQQLRKYLTQGGFLLVSPGCSDEKWDKSFRQEIKVCFPEYPLQKIPMTSNQPVRVPGK